MSEIVTYNPAEDRTDRFSTSERVPSPEVQGYTQEAEPAFAMMDDILAGADPVEIIRNQYDLIAHNQSQLPTDDRTIRLFEWEHIEVQIDETLELIAQKGVDLADPQSRADLYQKVFGAFIPTLAKGLEAVAGEDTDYGTPEPVYKPAKENDLYIQNQRDAGQIIIGYAESPPAGARSKSNKPSAYGFEIDASGSTRADPAIKSGGNIEAGNSSGASFKAVSLGLIPVANASEAGGSIQNPAELNQLYGGKGSKEAAGTGDWGPENDRTTVGTATRSVLQTAYFNTIQRGENPHEPGSEFWTARWSKEVLNLIADKKIAVLRSSMLGYKIDPERQAAFDVFIAELNEARDSSGERLFPEIEIVDPPAFSEEEMREIAMADSVLALAGTASDYDAVNENRAKLNQGTLTAKTISQFIESAAMLGRELKKPGKGERPSRYERALETMHKAQMKFKNQYQDHELIVTLGRLTAPQSPQQIKREEQINLNPVSVRALGVLARSPVFRDRLHDIPLKLAADELAPVAMMSFVDNGGYAAATIPVGEIARGSDHEHPMSAMIIGTNAQQAAEHDQYPGEYDGELPASDHYVTAFANMWEIYQSQQHALESAAR